MRNVAWKKSSTLPLMCKVCVWVCLKRPITQAANRPSGVCYLDTSTAIDPNTIDICCVWTECCCCCFFYSIGFYELNMCVIYAARTCQCWWQIRYIHPSIHCRALQTHELNVYNNHLKREDEEKSARLLLARKNDSINNVHSDTDTHSSWVSEGERERDLTLTNYILIFNNYCIAQSSVCITHVHTYSCVMWARCNIDLIRKLNRLKSTSHISIAYGICI